jgi:hypothetical protein
MIRHSARKEVNDMAADIDIKDQTEASRPPWRGWTRRHSVILLLISGIIVFAAFIARDEYRDDARDLAAAISSAQTVFVSRQDITVIADQVRYVGDLAGHIIVNQGMTADLEVNQKMQLTFHAMFVNRVKSVRVYARSFGVSLDSTRRLLTLVPDAGSSKRLDDLATRLSRLQDECAAAEKKFDKVDWGNATEKERQAAYHESATLLSYADGMSSEISELSQDVLSKAQAAQDSAVRDYRWFTRIGTGLFAIGLFVAFVAKVAGVEVFDVG